MQYDYVSMHLLNKSLSPQIWDTIFIINFYNMILYMNMICSIGIVFVLVLILHDFKEWYLYKILTNDRIIPTPWFFYRTILAIESFLYGFKIIWSSSTKNFLEFWLELNLIYKLSIVFLSILYPPLYG